MESLVKSLGGLVTPEIAGKLAKFLGVDAGLVDKAVKILSALAVGSMARKVATPQGAAAAFHALPQKEEPGMLSSLMSGLRGEIPGETSADKMQSMFGGGVNSMVSALSKKLGFDLAPLAGMVAPMLGQHFSKTAKEQGLDASGFARMLQAGNDEFQKDPANAEVIGIVRHAMAVGDQAEVFRSRFTPHELEEVHIAPLAAYCLVAKASPSGIKGSMDEMNAAHQVSVELLKDVAPISLLGTVFGGGLTSHEAEELKREVEAEDQLVETIRHGTQVMKSKAPAEVDT
ncbi:MAG: DUF937 domain-containing protein, partial [Verrucomicrobiaceae bacterium]